MNARPSSELRATAVLCFHILFRLLGSSTSALPRSRQLLTSYSGIDDAGQG